MKIRGAIYALVSFLILTLIGFVLLYYLTPIFNIDKFKEKPKCEIKVNKYSLINGVLTMNLQYKNCDKFVTISLKDGETGKTVCEFNTVLSNSLSISLASYCSNLQNDQLYTVYLNGKRYFSIVYIS